ncbi:CBU_0592 family membrane protein [Marmoricola endophyticus]|nr:hypothetical protein [Marmoricola endophyticus]
MSPTVLSFASALGWAGALGTVVAYALVSQKVLSATSRTFQATNAAAAAMLTVSALAHDSLPSAAANVVWVLIALVALVRSRATDPSGTAETFETGAVPAEDPRSAPLDVVAPDLDREPVLA